MTEAFIAPEQTLPSVLLGHSEDRPQRLLLSRANRHGVIAGATGTGKTITLQTLAYALSKQGVAIFAPDVKGDLSEISRIAPTTFWDLSGERGDRITVSIRDIGPALFARLLDASEPQERVIAILFASAREHELPLDTLDDVRAILSSMESNGAIAKQYGTVSKAPVSVLQGKILMLRESGADAFFGPTNFSLDEVISGRGRINILRAETLIHNPSLYATFLFWLLNELFVKLPEVGDLPQPKLVFFFDEAHLLFANATRPFLQKVEQVVRLIRSKGVGVYFVTQSPADIPDAILAQLGNRIQHALRAYTPNEQKGLRAAAVSFRPNPNFDTAETIQNLGVGEALVSLLDENGVPTIVERTTISMTALPAAPIAQPRPVVRPALSLVADNTRPAERAEPAERTPEPEPRQWSSDPVVPLIYQSPKQMVIDAPVAAVGAAQAPMIGTINMRDINLNFGPLRPSTSVSTPAPVRAGLPRLLWHAPIFVASVLFFWMIPLY